MLLILTYIKLKKGFIDRKKTATSLTVWTEVFETEISEIYSDSVQRSIL